MTACAGAVLFDMDRTLVRTDTSALYARYQRTRGEGSALHSARVAYWLVLHRLVLLDLNRAIEKTYAALRGETEHSLLEKGADWFRDGVREHIPEEARAAVRRHRERGDILAMTTGQTHFLATPVARELGIDHVVTTRLEICA
jgi:HAD superfamily phosphoserine phosphatase-like hydrolase